MRILAATIAALLCAAPALAAPTPSAPREYSIDDTGDLLARVYVSEAGWYSRADHAAIYWAIANRAEARGISFGQQLWAYTHGLSGESNRADWVRGLRTDLAEPAGWPSHLLWGPYRPRWGRVRVAAKTDIVFPPPNPCDGVVEHWGGMRIEIDRERANRAVSEGRWRRLSCAPPTGTQNAYFEVRRRR